MDNYSLNNSKKVNSLDIQRTQAALQNYNDVISSIILAKCANLVKNGDIPWRKDLTYMAKTDIKFELSARRLLRKKYQLQKTECPKRIPEGSQKDQICVWVKS